MAVEPNIAAGGFRTPLEKDTALLRQEYSNHPMLKNGLFNHPEFEQFTAAVITAEKSLVADWYPHLVAIEKTVSAFSDRLQTLADVLQSGQAAAAAQILELTREVKELRGGL
ncbi:hypothetical protein BJ878DRAFT_546859 [Calycina marina]|uniref:Uncharacterized protein n=1 Tax=Calycina marina TaxID=1763456 RepID=A0A9P8CAU9_9HELO|nr:hypothetical protein BJ878DRAFT_546859 [Calycina marina]